MKLIKKKAEEFIQQEDKTIQSLTVTDQHIIADSSLNQTASQSNISEEYIESLILGLDHTLLYCG